MSKHEYEAVRVILLSSPPQQEYIEFTLIFPDGYEKYYKLDGYAQRAYRGLGMRDIIEDQARQYFEQSEQPCDQIRLTFL